MNSDPLIAYEDDEPEFDELARVGELFEKADEALREFSINLALFYGELEAQLDHKLRRNEFVDDLGGTVG